MLIVMIILKDVRLLEDLRTQELGKISGMKAFRAI